MKPTTAVYEAKQAFVRDYFEKHPKATNGDARAALVKAFAKLPVGARGMKLGAIGKLRPSTPAAKKPSAKVPAAKMPKAPSMIQSGKRMVVLPLKEGEADLAESILYSLNGAFGLGLTVLARGDDWLVVQLANTAKL